MKRTVQVISVLAVLAIAAACGSGTDPSSPSSPSLDLAASPPKAEIDVSLAPDVLYGPSADPAYAAYVRLDSRITERAGLGAHLNYVRGDFFRNDILIERYDLGATRIIEETGSNRLEPGGSRSLAVLLRFSGPTDLIRVTFRFTDDQGHDHHLVGSITPSSASVAAALDGSSEAPRL